MLIILMIFGYSALLSNGDAIFRPCIPNTQFRMNGRLCFCDSLGRWSEASCEMTRRQTCKPGQIIWEDCSQCICQESGHFLCTNSVCGDDFAARPALRAQPEINAFWCVPFVSYYVNCSLCVCPASGRIKEARCARDASCPFKGVTDYQAAIKNHMCIPKVMYLFPCLQCHCSDDGLFVASKCVETCRKPLIDETTVRCIPKTFYRRDCNICWCPDNGIASESLCTKSVCKDKLKLLSLNSLRNITRKCQRHVFTTPRCFYCECSPHGVSNENSCLESDCVNSLNYEFTKHNCSPGEMVPICSECFCLKNGRIELKFCTKVCSYQQKLKMLETVVKEAKANTRLIDKGAIKKVIAGEECEPSSVYLDQGKYCLCPENGTTEFKLCSLLPVTDAPETLKPESKDKPKIIEIDFKAPCDPSTFIEFDCNTCYCTKSGKLDPKWCTYDDCEAKKIIQDSHKGLNADQNNSNGACVPGSLSKVGCNFCICNDNALLKDRACTKNVCTDLERPPTNLNTDKFTCEPLAYYNVDCNTCFCPNNGMKNIAKCTKNICEKNFLRSDVCVPGDLFSDQCNVCVCPPNGYKVDKVCTNYTCSDIETPWRKIFKLSQSLLSSSNMMDDSIRNLELCFPGEEFEIGCKVCVCPDMGLRVYAACTQMLCNDYKNNNLGPSEFKLVSDRNIDSRYDRSKRQVERNCMVYSKSESIECTAGSMYTIRCMQCMCPYVGNVHQYCRPLPREFSCDQPSAGLHHWPPTKGNSTKQNNGNLTVIKNPTSIVHHHTHYKCDQNQTDTCFLCECEGQYIIEEHCFKSNATECDGLTKPTFLIESDIVLV